MNKKGNRFQSSFPKLASFQHSTNYLSDQSYKLCDESYVVQRGVEKLLVGSATRTVSYTAVGQILLCVVMCVCIST